MKLIPIPLRDFAVPSPRTGSIEAASGSGRLAAEGQEIHARVQKRRSKADPLYQAEVAIRGLFDRKGFRFQVEGRMDGLYRHEQPRIEEIKSTSNLADLARRLQDDPFQHPYCLQLLTYGYLYWCEYGLLPHLNFYLVSSRNGESIHLDISLDLPLYEQWLDRRLDELAVVARQAEKRARRRKKVAAESVFPFAEPRPGQLELMEEIRQGMALGQPMLVQAPTGLGKTAAVLFPVLKEALSRGQRVIYATPKNSQHLVAEDAVARLQESGVRLRALTVTAKGKICPQGEPLCNPEICEFARDHYTKVEQHSLLDLLARKRRLRARLFRELAREYQVCPFELQMDCAHDVDIVICDYNYVFAPRSALSLTSTVAVDMLGLPSLVVDEAHNLPGRAMDYYSAEITIVHLKALREGIAHGRFGRQAEGLLEDCIAALISSCHGSGGRARRLDPPVALFQELDGRLRALVCRYLESATSITAQDPFLRLCFYWADFTAALELAGDPDREEFFATCDPGAHGGTLRVTCCDASRMLARQYDDFQHFVAFSATLKPFEYYARLMGLNMEHIRAVELGSPFPRRNRKLLIIPQVSTRYDRRERNYLRIADAVARIVALHAGNYIAFFPSFEFMERVAALFVPPPGFQIALQERGMRTPQVESLLDQLRSQDAPTIVFAVQGGTLSEGIDYPGNMIIGAFVIGPPLPNYDVEREQMRAYYQRRYRAGFDYAYTIPAMAKAVQSAGRVIRSESDRGVIVLMDSRFTEPGYSRAMPADWFDSAVGELVSESILADLSSFWKEILT